MAIRSATSVRRQLDATLRPFSGLKAAPKPLKGWIKAVREALGMSGRQLAVRLGVTPPRVTRLEKDEVSGALTLKTMRQTAEALDCIFVYALVPKSSLEETVRAQAGRAARAQSARAAHSMLLEAQSLTEEEARASFEETVEEMVRETPRDLWDHDS